MQRKKKIRVYLKKAPKDHVHIGLCLFYAGTAFRGLQLQAHEPTHHTVEGVVIQALKDVGLIEEVERGRIKDEDNHFGRSCRTDRGVHAVRNLVTLFVKQDALERAGGVDGAKERLNKALPSLVQVGKITVLTANFVPRSCCTRRVYRYLIPAYALLAPSDSFAALPKYFPDYEADALLAKASKTLSGNYVYDFEPSTAAAADAGEAPRWLSALQEKIETANSLIAKYFVGYHRFHNFSYDVDHERSQQNAKVIHPNDGEAARVVQRCSIASRLFLLPRAGEDCGLSRLEYVDNLRLIGKPLPTNAAASADSAVASGGDNSGCGVKPTWYPYVVFQIEGSSFLFNMIRKIVGCLLAVLRGAECSLLESALSPRFRVTTPLAPGAYLYLALSTYHSYDAELRSRPVMRFAALEDEWSGDVAQQAERFAWQTVTRDIVDMDLNALPPLDELLATRDAAYKLKRPQSSAEDSHLPSMKEYKPLEMGKTLTMKCSEMTVFLRLLRVHNWSIRQLNLQENSKALLEIKNGTLAAHGDDAVGVETPQEDSTPCDNDAERADRSEKMRELEGSADGWLYTATSADGAEGKRMDGRKRTRTWEEGGNEARPADTSV